MGGSPFSQLFGVDSRFGLERLSGCFPRNARGKPASFDGAPRILRQAQLTNGLALGGTRGGKVVCLGSTRLVTLRLDLLLLFFTRSLVELFAHQTA